MQTNIIYGPPGTGKTTFNLLTLQKELKEHDPDKIAYMSYTRKGTYEGRDRAKEKLKLTDEELPFFRTLHSIIFRHLGLSRSDIIQPQNYKQFSDAVGMHFTGYYTEDFKNDDDKYLFYNDLYRNNPYAADNFVNDLNPRILNWVTKEFARFKKELHLLDFTDILLLAIQEKYICPVEIAFIDEAQDLTTLQWQLIWIMLRDCQKVYIAGDDDQAVYEWAGADVNYFLKLKGSTTYLTKSWRLPDRIHRYALKVSDGIQQRIKKDFDYKKEGGCVQTLNDFRELVLNNEQTYMFLSRNSCFLKPVKKYLEDKGLVYFDKEKLSFDKNIIEAIKTHTKICKGENVSEAEKLRCKSKMKQDLKRLFKSPWYEEFYLTEEKIEYYRNIIANKTNVKNVNITVSTIHGVKGGQADNVILLLDYTRVVDKNYHKNPDSELRCYYVAVTRAKESLYLVYPSGNLGYKYLGR